MLALKAPSKYWNEPGVLAKCGPWVAAVGRRAFIIGGRTAWEKTASVLTESLQQAQVEYALYLHKGECTRDNIDRLAKEASRYQADLIIGVGGGRVLDVSKAVGDTLDVSVVTVPTVPATCAAWSALTVLYDNEGRSTGYWPLRRSPELVIADTNLLIAAPKRYLASGIGDTIVKWYETGINVLPGQSGGLDARIGLWNSRLAIDILNDHAVQVYNNADNGEITPAFIDVTDSILMLAGLVGSISSGVARVAFAHAIHDSLTWFPETHHSLHGEKVAFGLIAQLVLEGKAEEAEELAQFHRLLGLPITLRELGFASNSKDTAARIAAGVNIQEELLLALPFPADQIHREQAITEADLIGQSVLTSSLLKID